MNSELIDYIPSINIARLREHIETASSKLYYDIHFADADDRA